MTNNLVTVLLVLLAFFAGLGCGYRVGVQEVMRKLFSAIEGLKNYTQIKKEQIENERKANGKPE